MELEKEFDQQLQNLRDKNYPPQAIDLAEKLKSKLPSLLGLDLDIDTGRLPFVIVVKSSLVPTETAMSRVTKGAKPGITKLYPHMPQDFQPVDFVNIPTQDVYLLVDIDRGKNNINLPPKEALKIIQSQSRSPLTLDEGVAVITHYPDFLIKNNCFSLLASRNPNDKRVPAIWINAQGHPNLGWCWEGNPHTWLGSASCLTRVG